MIRSSPIKFNLSCVDYEDKINANTSPPSSMEDQICLPPHVLIFPFPFQGHVNSMLKLAELLCISGIHVTFIVSINNKQRLLRFTDVQSRFSLFPGFHFLTLPETFLESSGLSISEIYDSLTQTSKPFLNDLLQSNTNITTIIVDGVFNFLIDIAIQMEIPIYYFRTISSCAFWAYFRIRELILSNEIPFPGDNLDVRVSSVTGMEEFLRRRDLPSFFRDGVKDETFQMMATETRNTNRVNGLILNTFDDLEGPILDQIRTECPNLYTIGPLHAHLKTRLAATSASSNSLWAEDKSCMTWLDLQPSKSVLYVSFGSIATMTFQELMEFWYGLVNSGHRFLWVRRPGSVAGEDRSEIPAEILEGTKNRGYLVEWAPQEQVLAHPSVAGFLTHSGWNSTLESIVEGIPMICWPFFADQQTNSRFVGEVWKLGLDMKDTCSREIVEKMVRDLMARKEEFLTVAGRMARLARKSVSKGGSSYCNLDRLISDIRRQN